MSALPPKADIAERRRHFRFVPIGDIGPTRESALELTSERELHWECQLLGRFRETSPAQIFTFGHQRWRASSSASRRSSARLPDPAGAHHRRLCRRRLS
jgi:hypothetical protein